MNAYFMTSLLSLSHDMSSSLTDMRTREKNTIEQSFYTIVACHRSAANFA
jgi:hypothetical protein